MSKIGQFIFLYIIHLLYCILGSVTFTHLEGECRNKSKLSSHKLCMELQNSFENLTSSGMKHSEMALLYFRQLHEICLNFQNYTITYSVFDSLQNDNNGSSSSSVQKECNKWSLENLVEWFTFSETTIFTIGYGHVVPHTKIGKMTTLVYAAVGIPIALAMLSAASETITHYISIIIFKFEKRFCGAKHKAKPNNIKVFFATLLVFLLTILIGAIIATDDSFYNMTWFNATYYWFVTITTIGFGDIEMNHNFYDGWNFLYLIPHIICATLGVALTATMCNIASKLIGHGQWKSKYFTRNLKKKIKARNQDSYEVEEREKHNEEQVKYYRKRHKMFSDVDIHASQSNRVFPELYES